MADEDDAPVGVIALAVVTVVFLFMMSSVVIGKQDGHGNYNGGLPTATRQVRNDIAEDFK